MYNKNKREFINNQSWRNRIYGNKIIIGIYIKFLIMTNYNKIRKD